jgi:hypothetical protein
MSVGSLVARAGVDVDEFRVDSYSYFGPVSNNWKGDKYLISRIPGVHG